MKKVLITLDYDPSAQTIAEQGYLLAKSMDAKVILMHVFLDPSYYSEVEHIKIMGFAGHLDTNIKPLKGGIEPEQFSQEFLNKSKLHLGNEDIETIIKKGDIIKSILKTAQEIKADFIVMGSHSRRWFEDIPIGSITEKVLMNTDIPVVVIPTKKR